MSNLFLEEKVKPKNLKNFKEYNICTGVKTSVREFSEELYKQVYQKYKIKSELIFGALQFSPFEIMDVENDCSGLRQLGWSPTLNTMDGIKRLLDVEK